MPVSRGVIDKRDMNTPIQFQIWNRNVKCKVFVKCLPKRFNQGLRFLQ